MGDIGSAILTQNFPAIGSPALHWSQTLTTVPAGENRCALYLQPGQLT